MPSAVEPTCAEIPWDLSVVKVKTSEGLVARLLTVGIVVMLLSKSTRAFLQSRHRARASRPWAMLGHRDPREAAPAVGHWAAGPEWVVAGPFLFLMHFNLVSKVNL